MAAWLIAIVLAGFIPDSLMKVEMVRTGARPPFPLVLHMHAVLMGSFLLMLLTQTWLMATGRRNMHMQLGIAGFVLAAGLVLVGAVLAPTMYYQTWNGLQAAQGAQRETLTQVLSIQENILLLQMRIGILFPLLLAIGFKARAGNSGLHKRMVIIGTAVAVEAGIARIPWLPTTMPEAPLSMDLFVLLSLAPMLAWDVIRNRRVHEAYWTALAVIVPAAILVEIAWNQPWWHATAKAIMGVG